MFFYKILKEVIEMVPEAKPLLFRSTLLACISALLMPIPVITAWLIVRTHLDSTFSTPLWPLCLAALLAVGSMAACRLGSSVFSHKAAFLLGTGLCTRLMEHLGRLPVHWHAQRSSGSIKKVLNYDIEQIEHFTAHNITECISGLLLPLCGITVICVLDWRIAIIMVFILAAAVVIHISTFSCMKNSKLNDEYYAAVGTLHSDVMEFVQGMHEIKIFNRTADSFGRMQKAVEKFKEVQLAVRKMFTFRWVGFITVTAMPFTVLGLGGAFLHLRAGLPLDDTILFLMFGSVCFAPLPRLARFMAFLWRAYAGYLSVKSILDVPAPEREVAAHDRAFHADLHVENLSVEYEGKPVLNNISFHLPAGSVTAIIGHSGSGKSTIASVLAGMEAATTGTIHIGDLALSSFSSAELANVIAVVFQQPFIFSGTVAENICLGRPDTPRAAMLQAARMVQCDTFVEHLPEGYETRLGAGGGVHLSGGQKQRIALARMALRNAPIVVLDEATAFSDPESEEAIQEGLSGLLTGKTVLVIAHRLPSIARADSIIVLEKGNIVERGNHGELMAAKGAYSRMWEAYQTSRSWMLSTEQATKGAAAC